MGRKIPARKHMGVRDPLRKNAEKLALIKDKINNPPEKQDFQKVSHSLARFIKLKEEAKLNDANEKKKKFVKAKVDNEDRPENYKSYKGKKTESRNDKELPKITQRQNEGDRAYLRRIHRITHESHQEAKFEAKYGVEVVRDKKTGEIKIKKRPKDELEEHMKQQLQNQKENKKGGKSVTPAIVISTEEKKKLVKEMIEQKRSKKDEAKPKIEEYKKDEFRFGEVVHEPPTLSKPRHAQKAETVPRPGKKALLLHSVIEDHTTPVESTKEQKPQNLQSTTAPPSKKNIGTLKGKRKDLSMALRYMIDTEQNNVVQLYKQMKKTQRAESIVNSVKPVKP